MKYVWNCDNLIDTVWTNAVANIYVWAFPCFATFLVIETIGANNHFYDHDSRRKICAPIGPNASKNTVKISRRHNYNLKSKHQLGWSKSHIYKAENVIHSIVIHYNNMLWSMFYCRFRFRWTWHIRKTVGLGQFPCRWIQFVRNCIKLQWTIRWTMFNVQWQIKSKLSKTKQSLKELSLHLITHVFITMIHMGDALSAFVVNTFIAYVLTSGIFSVFSQLHLWCWLRV